MKVKICGITDLNTARNATDSGADAIGFVFAKSKRNISSSAAKQIIEGLPPDVMKVGVFVNETKDLIERIIHETGLTHVQLHGEESPAFCRSLSVPVIKAGRIQSYEDAEILNDYPCDYVLFDSPGGKYQGGNGIAFDWDVIKNLSLPGKKIILAGGLTIENVREAIGVVKPFMVDVSSGVETDGKKDPAKIKEFIQKAKGFIEKKEDAS